MKMATNTQVATVQHYQDGGIGGQRATIPYTGLDDVIAWSEGQAGHPWDGVLVTVYDADDHDHRNPIETHQVELRSLHQNET